MDKNPMGLYFTNSERGATPHQFFVMQDTEGRQVQYYVSLQNVKSAVENVPQQAAYHVSQCYVDSENSSQVLAVSDINVPDEENIYTSNYLIQPESCAEDDQMEQNTVDEIKNIQSDIIENDNSNIDSNLIEITLDQEQCQEFEQKGWVLLETKSNEKVYVLDSVGLHDITTNEKLIHSLREIAGKKDLELNSGSDKDDSTSCDTLDDKMVQDQDEEMKAIEHIIDTDSNSHDNKGNLDYAVKNTDSNTHDNEENLDYAIKNEKGKVESQLVIQTEASQLVEQAVTLPEIETSPIEKTRFFYKKRPVPTKRNVLKLKTNLSFKDIPDKIVLGKTKLGKNLVAKITKQTGKSGAKDSILKQTILESDSNVQNVDNNRDSLVLKYPVKSIKKPDLTYACSVCASLFHSELALQDHLEDHVASEFALTVGNELMNGIYSVMGTGKQKTYSCLHCKATFKQYSHCIRHIKTHLHLKKEETLNSASGIHSTTTTEMLDCKMCSCSFNHPSTLSKHIVTKHIKPGPINA